MLNRIESEIQILETIIEFNGLDVRLNELFEIPCIRKEDWTFRYNKGKTIISERESKIYRIYTIFGNYYSLFFDSDTHGKYDLLNSKYYIYWKGELLV